MQWRWVWCVRRIKGHQHHGRWDKVRNLGWWEEAQRGLVLTGGQGAGEKQVQWGGGGTGGHVALRKGHVGGTSRNPHSSEMSLHPPYQHPPLPASHAQIWVQFWNQALQTTDWLGFGCRTVFLFVDTACGSLCVHLSGGPAMHPATRKSVFISSFSPWVTSPADLASPNISHIICYLSAPFQAPSSLTGSFITALLLQPLYCFRSCPLQSSVHTYHSNNDHCLLIMYPRLY